MNNSPINSTINSNMVVELADASSLSVPVLGSKIKTPRSGSNTTYWFKEIQILEEAQIFGNIHHCRKVVLVYYNLKNI